MHRSKYKNNIYCYFKKTTSKHQNHNKTTSNLLKLRVPQETRYFSNSTPPQHFDTVAFFVANVSTKKF